MGQPPARRRSDVSSACAPVRSSSPRPGCSTASTRPATGPASTPCRTRHPAVHWLRGRRYVEDGSVTTTAAVTSGVPAALHLVAELAGPAEAQRVADLHPELGWTPTETTTIGKDHFAVRDWPVGLNYLEPWFRPTIGIALHDGVGELDATAAFEVYGQSAAAQAIAVATGDTVQHPAWPRPAHHPHSRRRPTSPGSSCPVQAHPAPSTRDCAHWADHRHLAVEPLTGRPGPDGPGDGGFTAALQNLADHTDASHHPHDRENDRLPHHRAQPRPCGTGPGARSCSASPASRSPSFSDRPRPTWPDVGVGVHAPARWTIVLTPDCGIEPAAAHEHHASARPARR